MAGPVDDCRQLCGVRGCWCQFERDEEKSVWPHWQKGEQCCICARRFHSGSDRIACGGAKGKCPTDCYICLSVDQKGVRRYDKQADHHDVCNCCGGFTRARFLRASCQREGITPFAGWAPTGPAEQADTEGGNVEEYLEEHISGCEVARRGGPL